LIQTGSCSHHEESAEVAMVVDAGGKGEMGKDDEREIGGGV